MSMQKYAKILVAAAAICGSIQSKQCKVVDSLLVKCTLRSLGSIRACGTIVGSNTGKLIAYGSFYSTQTGQTINTGDVLIFTDDSVAPVGLSHATSPFSAITIQVPGVYLMMAAEFDGIVFMISQFYVNGQPLAGGDDGGVTASLPSTIATLYAGDVVTVKNVGGPITIAPGAPTPLRFQLLRIG